jgi:hexosaminidase
MMTATLLNPSHSHRLRYARCLAVALLLAPPAFAATPGAAIEPAAASGLQASIIPIPQVLTPRPGTLRVTSRTPLRAASPVALPAARYLAQLVRMTPGIALHPVVAAAGAAANGVGSISLQIDPQAPGTDPESYQLEVDGQGARISARDPRGLLYGALTLWELMGGTGATPDAVTLRGVHIEDAPQFRWRGLMLDSARHFQSVDFILRYIDWMALHKLNVLGWHLTDDQGWRLESTKYPRLTGVGAWRVPAGRAARRDLDPATGRPRLYGGFYTRQDVRRIVAHAALRNVTIVPEIDLPGHSTAALVAYPALAALPQALPAAVPADWGIFTHVLNIDEATFRFIEDVLDEVMALFPGEYIHVGGDEVVTDEWRDSPAVQARMRELGIPDVSGVQGYFTRRLGEYLAGHGRRLVGWDEIVKAGLAPGATVMSWRGTDGAVAAARAGHYAVLSPDPVLYLDHRQGSTPAEPPGRGRVVSIEDIYRFDPLQGLLAQESGHLLGLQANLWTEHLRTDERASYMSFPRAAALAEVAWSKAEKRSWPGFLERLPAEFNRYRALGVTYAEDVFMPPHTVGPYARHMSQDLASCTDKLLLNLEDDAPLHGPRAVFLIDIMNPCWIFPAIDLSPPLTLTAAVGQVPFNFQIGKDIEAIHLDSPHSAAGELEVRIDSCDGPPAVLLPLAAAAESDAVTVLPAVPLPRVAGTHRLCLRFAQHGLDPMWALDSVQVSP